MSTIWPCCTRAGHRGCERVAHRVRALSLFVVATARALYPTNNNESGDRKKPPAAAAAAAVTAVL